MKENYFDTTPLIKWQRWSWYIFSAYFALVTVLFVAGSGIAETLTVWGIVGILVSTLLKIFLFVKQFQKARLFRFSLLSYLLVVILLSTVILKYWIL